MYIMNNLYFIVLVFYFYVKIIARTQSKLFSYRVSNTIHDYTVTRIHCITYRFVTLTDIPVKEADRHDNFAILVTSGGGHVGYMGTFWPFTSNNFMLKLIQQYFVAIMADKNYERFVNH